MRDKLEIVDQSKSEEMKQELHTGETVLPLPVGQIAPGIHDMVHRTLSPNVSSPKALRINPTQVTAYYGIKVQRTDGNDDIAIPRKMSDFAAGFDLQAAVTEPLVLEPMQRVLVPTGLIMAIHPDLEGQIRPRSGLAYKHGITVLNTPGTIDSDYRGEVKVLLINLGQEPFTINRGERIAQIVFGRVLPVIFDEGDVNDDTTRGAGGFGHTGV